MASSDRLLDVNFSISFLDTIFYFIENANDFVPPPPGEVSKDKVPLLDDEPRDARKALAPTKKRRTGISEGSPQLRFVPTAASCLSYSPLVHGVGAVKAR